MLPMEPAWDRPMMTVMCGYENDRLFRDPHLDCDGMFCGCPCHVARDRERWMWMRKFYFEDNPRAAANQPTGVL